MALSNVTYTGNGSTQLYTVPFPYLSREHVKVYLDGVLSIAYTWSTSSSISFTSAPANGVVIAIQRVTPTAPLVDFVDGSNLTESILDTATLQSLYVVEETKESVTGTLQLDSITNTWDAENKRIVKLANPVGDQDAATKGFVSSFITDSVNAASASASAALASAEAAEDFLNDFEARYLGSKASAPTLDNDGNVLVEGAVYWNSTSKSLFIWDGSAWDQAAFNVTGIGVSSFNTRTGAVTLSSSDVTTALGFTPVDTAAVGTTVQPYDVDTAKLDVDQSWTGAQRGAITTDNDLSFDLNAANNFSCTPPGSGSLTFTNIATGQSGFILLVNSSGHTISLHSNTKADSNFATTVSAAGTYLISYFSKGTNVYCVTSGAIA